MQAARKKQVSGATSLMTSGGTALQDSCLPSMSKVFDGQKELVPRSAAIGFSTHATSSGSGRFSGGGTAGNYAAARAARRGC